MNLSFAMVALAAGFGSVTYVIERAEQKAKTCTVHSRKAGAIARLLGVFCGIMACALLVAAFVMRSL